MSQPSSSLHLIGKVHSSQGVRGQIFVVLFPDSAPWIKKWKTLVLSLEDHEGSPRREIPILRAAPHGKQGKKGFILTLEGITDKDVADTLAKQWVWIPQAFLQSQKGESIYLREILSFRVIDKERGDVGTITGFSSNGPQDLIQIQTTRGLYDVPLVQPFIERIEFEDQKIYMDIPQGLLEDT